MKTDVSSILPVKTVTPMCQPKVGDILCGTWGYEARLATFAKVVAVGAKTIKVVELARENFDYEAGGMDWKSKPGSEIGSVVTKTPHLSETTYSIKWDSTCNLYKWEGKSVNCYNYH